LFSKNKYHGKCKLGVTLPGNIRKFRNPKLEYFNPITLSRNFHIQKKQSAKQLHFMDIKFHRKRYTTMRVLKLFLWSSVRFKEIKSLEI